MSVRVNNQVVSPETKSLWMGEIEPWMEENSISKLYSHVAPVANVKVIKDKMTGLPSGYGFVEFENHETAKRVLESCNGRPIPGMNKNFRLNWAVQSGGAPKPHQQPMPSMGGYSGGGGGGGGGGGSSSTDHSVYVGDLDPNVTDSILLDAFSSQYTTILSANVIVDPLTKRSKKYGFIRFGDFEESQKAIHEMNGKYVLSRPIKLNVGFKKSNMGQQQQQQNSFQGGGGYNSNYPSYGGGGGGGYSAPGGYGAPPAYPPSGYPPQSSYPGYNPDPYAPPSQYPSYGSYPYSYPPSTTAGSGYGMSVGGKEYPTASPYGGYGGAGSYGGYDSKGYGDHGANAQSYPSYGQGSTAPAPSTSYQYNYGAQNSYDYGTQGVPATAAQETHLQKTAPVAAQVSAPVAEIDLDLEVSKVKPIYKQDQIQTLNREYYDSVMGEQGSIDMQD